jgi:hypothetical protein
MITCGLCGSGITADEKFKRQKNGNEHRYVYYGCTKFNDKHCKCEYIREEDLVEQLANVIDTISLDKIGMRDRIKTEIKAHNEFQQSVLGQEKMQDTSVKDVDIRNYAKHILRTRPLHEKRELLGNLRSKLIFTEKTICIKE